MITPKWEEVGTIVEHPDLNSEFVLMQFTGLTDKNGKEIYEGDIVRRWRSPVPKVVEWKTDRWVYTGFNVSSNSKYGNTLEVIGNIYQNPELLNPAS